MTTLFVTFFVTPFTLRYVSICIKTFCIPHNVLMDLHQIHYLSSWKWVDLVQTKGVNWQVCYPIMSEYTRNLKNVIYLLIRSYLDSTFIQFRLLMFMYKMAQSFIKLTGWMLEIFDKVTYIFTSLLDDAMSVCIWASLWKWSNTSLNMCRAQTYMMPFVTFVLLFFQLSPQLHPNWEILID